MKHQRRIIAASMIGNLIEAFDVTICVYMAFYLSSYLMDDNHKSISLIFALFCLAYAARPLGAIILGTLSDKLGRKKILVFSILTLGLSTMGIAFIPPANQIGYLAAVCLLILRTIQSFAYGSEYLSSVSLLVESGSHEQKTYRGSFTSAGIMSGVLLASLLAEGIDAIVTPATAPWLWRIPFLLAGIGALFGLYLRARIPESLEYVKLYSRQPKPSAMAIFRQALLFVQKQPFIFYFGFIVSLFSIATTFLFYVYVPIHSEMYHHLTAHQVLIANSLSLAFMVGLIPWFGKLVDKLDRLKMMSIATVLIIALSYPFINTLNYGSFLQLIIIQLTITIPIACYYSISSVLLTELLPVSIRCTVLSITYSLISVNLAAGLIPLLAIHLIEKTHNINSPVWIILSLGIVALCNFQLLAKKYRHSKNQYTSSNFINA